MLCNRDNQKRHHENPYPFHLHRKKRRKGEEEKRYHVADDKRVNCAIFPPRAHCLEQVSNPNRCYRDANADEKREQVRETEMEIPCNAFIPGAHPCLVFLYRCPECLKRPEPG